MTKTYSDIEAVTRLLEEKEKDLELTARIGKELLSQNARLESNVHELEGEVNKCRETITQLQHEILRKTELIQVMTNDATPVSEDESPTWSPGAIAGGPSCRISDGFKLLEKKIATLEVENSELRVEAGRLARETEETEAEENRLVQDLMSRLEGERGAMAARDAELERLRIAVSDLQESLEVMQERVNSLTQQRDQAERERDEYISKWHIGRETETELVTELAQVKDRYSELLTYLDEIKEGVRKNKKKGPTVRTGPLGYPSLGGMNDSLANELETSLLSELSLDSGISGTSGLGISLPSYKRVFDTVRCASSLSSRSGSTAGGSMAPDSPPKYQPPTLATVGHPIDTTMPQPPPYIGGGMSELEAAMKKLTPSAVESRRQALSSLHDQTPLLPYECMTPDSFISHGTASSGPWKFPDKLQIVKPLEGSLTLHHWSELATPSLGGLLDERPGVKTRGGTDLEALGFHLYSLSDMEEDDDSNPGKSFQQSSHIYTFTNSTIMHHTDSTQVTHSYRGSQMSSAVSSRVSSVCSTPMDRGLSRRSSVSSNIGSVGLCSSTGLAQMINDRGLSASTAPTVVIPPYTPTATPPPSPTRSLSPDPSEADDEDSSYSTLGLPGFLMTSGAELLKRTLGSALKSPTTAQPKTALVRPDNKAALTGIRLVETLERIGLEEILASSPSSTLHQAGLRRKLADSVSGGGVLGVPGRPGRGELLRNSSNNAGARRVRPDLGSVPTPTTPAKGGNNKQDSPQPHQQQPHHHSALGTLSSLLFGRKGGLL